MTVLRTILLQVVVILVVAYLVRRGPRKERERVRGIARDLGMETQTFDGLGRRLEAGASGRAAEPGMPPLIAKAAAAWGSSEEYDGTHQGRAVRMHRRLRFRVVFGAVCAGTEGLFVTPQATASPHARVMTPERPMPAVASGDAAFDEAMRLGARNAETARALLARADVRAALDAAVGGEPAASVVDGWLYLAPRDTDVKDTAAASALRDEVVRRAAALESVLARA